MERYLGIKNNSKCGVTCSLNGDKLSFNGVSFYNLLGDYGKAYLKTNGFNDYFRLGWNSIAMFEENASTGKLKLLHAYEIDPEHNIIELSNNGNFSTASTYLVESCTYIHVKITNYHIVAHLDRPYLTEGRDKIKNFIKELNCENVADNAIDCICSRYQIDGDGNCLKPQEFENAILQRLEKFGYDKSDAKTFIRNDSGKNCIHFEIGIYSDPNNNIKEFGDICESPVGKHTLINKNQIQFSVKTFNGVEQLMDINKNQSTGGCCRIS